MKPKKVVVNEEVIGVSDFLNRLHRRFHVKDGRRVYLDEDVAQLYGVAATVLRRMVSRNISRFPADTYFRKADGPYLFTEEGVLLLASVLKTPQAVQTSIEVIRELFGFESN